MSKVVCIIPVRYHSSRFEGKPLADICGETMIRRVYEKVSRSNSISYVAVATDDERIYDEVLGFGGKAVMTSPLHRSGTDRIFEAVQHLDLQDSDIVVNMQGDQPLFHDTHIEAVANPLRENSFLNFCTLAYRIQREEEINHPNAVKVVFDRNNFALYFSRATIPYVRDDMEVSYYKHLGIYSYRYSFLQRFTTLEDGYLEKREALEQLRALEHGYKIKIVETPYDSIEVDSIEDIERVRAIISEGKSIL